MYDNQTIGVVIPCYNGGKTTLRIIQEAIDYVDIIVLVDDQCPQKTGKMLENKITNDKIHVIYNKSNLGVGAATKIGFDYLLGKHCDVILKIDADGQMNPADLPKMYVPIVSGYCDSTKGNRFTEIDKLRLFPKARLLGNLVLSFMTKLSTGYWELFDPTNGFIGFSREVLEEIQLHKTDNRYFFETDLLFRCSLKNISILNVPIDPLYENHISSLNPWREMPIFFVNHIKLAIKRILYQYYILDFNPASIELLLSVFIGFIALMIGAVAGYNSNFNNILATAGTASLFTISCLLSIQFFLSFIYYDCTLRLMLRQKYPKLR